MEHYPPNSDRSRTAKKEPQRVERVTTSEPIRRKKGVGKQFRSTFLGGDAHSALQYVIFGVLIPAAKDALAEAGAQGIERLIFGDSRARSRATRPTSGATGFINYQARSNQPQPQVPRSISRRAQSQHDFDEIVLTSRAEAEEVIDGLYDILARDYVPSVADLYVLVGLKPSHTDNKWGWTDLRGASVVRVRNGYLLDLPEPEPLD
jgi:hypothetical protein